MSPECCGEPSPSTEVWPETTSWREVSSTSWAWSNPNATDHGHGLIGVRLMRSSWRSDTGRQLSTRSDPLSGSHACTGQSVEHVALQTVAGWQGRVVEVVTRIVGHAQTLHHAARAVVDRCRERKDLVQLQSVESIGDRGSGGLGRVAVTPMWARESPTDFDCGRERRIEGGGPQPDVTGEGSGSHDFHREQSEASGVRRCP